MENIKISAELAELLEERGLKEADVQEVIEYAESTGKKLYIEGEEHFLQESAWAASLHTSSTPLAM